MHKLANTRYRNGRLGEHTGSQTKTIPGDGESGKVIGIDTEIVSSHHHGQYTSTLATSYYGEIANLHIGIGSGGDDVLLDAFVGVLWWRDGEVQGDQVGSWSGGYVRGRRGTYS